MLRVCLKRGIFKFCLVLGFFFREKSVNIAMRIEPRICLLKKAEVLHVLDNIE